MFKSFHDRIKSLLSSSTNDTQYPTGSKRKRSFDTECSDEEDPDVQIVKVEKKRKLDPNNPFFSILRLPSKMGEWMKLKSKSFSDQFNTEPVDGSRRKGPRNPVAKRNGLPSRMMSGIHYSNRKGLESVVQLPGAYAMDMTGYDGTSSSTPCDLSNNMNGSKLNGERRSSNSSLYRPCLTSSSSMQCIRLKEREEYQKLIKMQAQLSSPSRRSFTRDSDVLSVSSGSSSDLTFMGTSNFLSQPSRQSRLPSNTSIFDTHHSKNIPNSPVTASHVGNNRSYITKRRPVDHTKLSLESLVARQKRGLAAQERTDASFLQSGAAHQKLLTGQKSQVASESKATPSLNRSSDAVEARKSLHYEETEALVIIDDDEEEEEDHVKVEQTKSSDFKRPVSSLATASADASSSRTTQNKSLDFRDSVYMTANYMEQLKNSRLMQNDQWKRQVAEEEMKAKAYEKKRRAQNIELERRLKHQMRIFEDEPEVSEEILLQEEEEEEDVLPELTDEMLEVVRLVLRPGPPGEVISTGFRLQITRSDMATLAGLNWLNDEIINFYMNMLMERGEKEGMAKTYAFNTFFYPKVMSGGHSAVKRWTKKVDIFGMHFILIPVHLGMHWCLCVVDMEDKAITYYDSMGGKNNDCLQAVLKYINEESVCKKQQPINTADWKLEIAQDNPQQLNGSDCGMFSCKYAEYITRGKKVSFTQEDMPYFRQRMIYEIKTKTLLQ